MSSFFKYSEKSKAIFGILFSLNFYEILDKNEFSSILGKYFRISNNSSDKSSFSKSISSEEAIV